MTGISSGKLSYLDRTGLVVPKKFGDKHPVVVYSWQQILQLKIIDRLREKLSLQEIRKVIDFLQQQDYKPSLFTCNLVFIGEQLYLLNDWEDFGTRVLEASGKNKGQIVVHQVGTLAEVISELRREALHQRVLDFDKRAKGTPLDMCSGN
jgi:DNA-binding transcriptional MerR regulator